MRRDSGSHTSQVSFPLARVRVTSIGHVTLHRENTMGSTTPRTIKPGQIVGSTTAVEDAGPDHLVLDICGKRLAVLKTMVSDQEKHPGRAYYTLRKRDGKASMYGVPLEVALAATFPTSVTIDGVEIPLAKGETTKGQPKVHATKRVLLPSLGEERNVAISISLRSNGGWQVKVSVTRGGSASTSLDDLLAA